MPARFSIIYAEICHKEVRNTVFHQTENSSSNYSYNIVTYSNQTINYHFHKNLELIYVISGSVKCTVNGSEYAISAGEFGLCLPFDIHCYQPQGNAKYWVLVFSEDFVHSFSKRINGYTGKGFIFMLTPTTDAYIQEMLIKNTAPTIYTMKSCLYAICEEYLNSVELTENNKRKADKIAFIVDYIAKHHTERITLSDIAKELGYDYNYISRSFKNTFNISFKEFLNLYRLETAIALLDAGELTVTEIAYESGFQSIRSFHDFFRRKMNTSPAKYRKGTVTEAKAMHKFAKTM